jgi:hypothetical protein
LTEWRRILILYIGLWVLLELDIFYLGGADACIEINYRT